MMMSKYWRPIVGGAVDLCFDRGGCGCGWVVSLLGRWEDRVNEFSVKEYVQWKKNLDYTYAVSLGQCSFHALN
jgi:hypothetical protein